MLEKTIFRFVQRPVFVHIFAEIFLTMSRQKSIFIFVLLCLCGSLWAQNKVTGVIVDERSNQVVPFVNAGLFRSADSVFVCGAASDDKGAFTLQNVPNGSFELRVSAIGYQVFKRQLEIAGNMDLGRLPLQQGTTTLDEVVIAEKRPLFSVEGEKSLYNVAEDPSIQTGTASDALQNAPGVEVDVEGNVTLRGTSSVEIWVNDKPTHMNAENLKTYIQQMPANSIDRIEVITNPSARYGTQSDGIINIVTNAKIQRNEFFSFGLNGSTMPFVMPWASYVWANDKLTVNAYVNGNLMRHIGTGSSDRNIYNENGILSNHQYDTSSFNSRNVGGGGFLNINYDFDTANSISFNLMAWPYFNSNMASFATQREMFDSIGHPFNPAHLTDYSVMNSGKNTSVFGMANIYYQHKFDNKGHNLSLSFSSNLSGNHGTERFVNTYVQPVEYIRDRYEKGKRLNGGQNLEVIYNRPYSEKGEISVGYATSYSPNQNMTVVDTLANGQYVNDDKRSYSYNAYSFNNEVFITLQHKFGNFTVKPGLRAGYEFTGIRYPDASSYDSTWRFFNLMPSLHLSYRTQSMHNFQASYSRRISNPSSDNLSPYIIYHEESFGKGSPDLESVFTDAVELKWTKFWNNFGSVGLTGYYRGKSNEINTITVSKFDPLYGRLVPFSYPVNVGKSYNAGTELMVMYRPSGFFNIRFYANLYDSYLKTVYRDKEVTGEKLTYSFRLNVWTKLWNRLEVHASANYRSPTMSLFAERRGMYGINCGMRADFFDRRMSVFFNARDIFNWNSFGESVSSPYVQSTNTFKFNSRSVSLGVTFRFGKMELESKARQGSEADGAQMGGM